MEIQKFVDKFAEAIELEESEVIKPETKFRSLGGWSSISVMLAIAFFDEEFEREVSGQDIKRCETIQDLYDLATK